MENEETAKAWEEYVRSEMNAILDIYLPDAVEGNVGIRYGSPVVGTLEDGTVLYDDDHINTVMVTMVLKLENPLDKPK